MDIGEARAAKVVEIAQEIDLRRQKQIENQKASINRLLAADGPDPETATREIARLNEELARSQRKYELLVELARRDLPALPLEMILAEVERQEGAELPSA